MDLKALLDRRLLLVSGKGGTGKTTLSGALALHHARAGRRTLVIEVDNQKAALPRLLGMPDSYKPVPVEHNLWACNLVWDHALEEWLDRNIPVKRINKLILGNRVVRVFLDATPGARETAVLSAVAELAEAYDRVVVDLPASGHAISLLRVPHITLRLIRAGPLRTRAEHILALLGRSSTAMVLCALPEEMVVNEALETVEVLRREVPEVALPAVFLNRSAPPSLSPDERTLLEALQAAARGDLEGEVMRAGAWEAGLEDATASATARLREAGLLVVPIPRLGVLGGLEPGATRVMSQMASALTRASLREAS